MKTILYFYFIAILKTFFAEPLKQKFHALAILLISLQGKRKVRFLWYFLKILYVLPIYDTSSEKRWNQQCEMLKLKNVLCTGHILNLVFQLIYVTSQQFFSRASKSTKSSTAMKYNIRSGWMFGPQRLLTTHQIIYFTWSRLNFANDIKPSLQLCYMVEDRMEWGYSVCVQCCPWH